jgi:chromosome partitioning protein
MISIAVINQKGGTGKTTTAVNLAAGLAHQGARVLAVDLDPQAHATWAFGINSDSLRVEETVVALFQDIAGAHTRLLSTREPTLKVLPATIRMARSVESLYSVMFREVVLQKALEPLAAEFDYAIFDCAPNFGVLALNALVAAEKILIPTQLAVLPLSGLADLLDTLQAVKQDVPHEWRILLTMVHGYGEARQQAAWQMLDPLREHILETRIHRTEAIERSQPGEEAERIYAVVLEKTAANRGARDYKNLVREVGELWPV